MKILIIGLFAFAVLLASACNNHQGKRTEVDSTFVKDLTYEKPGFKGTYKTAQVEPDLCDSIATEILTTSPRYKELTKGLNKAIVKNGGLSFGFRLERSPNNKQDSSLSYSKTYDFAFYEVYTDRELNTARFSFNPNSKQLYEYDEVNNQLEPIEFDRDLLAEYDTLCR